MRLDFLDRLSEIDQAEVVRCARLLLRRPLVRSGGPDGELLPLLYRHQQPLAELFTQLLGYRLVVERRFARLHKASPGEDATRGVSSLTPRGYAYVALCLAVLVGMGQQTLLSRLVTDIRAAAGEAGIEVADDLTDRRALTAALRYLIGLGVLTETDGTVDQLRREAAAEALITIDVTLLAQIVTGPVSDAVSPRDLVELAARPGARGVEHAVRRRLVEHPVTHYADLAREEAAWLRQHSRREAALLDRCFGLLTEIRAEGVAVTDPGEYLGDIPFPGQSTPARITLLALPSLLATGHPDVGGWTTVTRDEAEQIIRELVQTYPKAWSAQKVDDIPTLVDDSLHLLRTLGLARPAPDARWRISPAAHRWLPRPDADPHTADSEPHANEPGLSLFDNWLFDGYEGGTHD